LQRVLLHLSQFPFSFVSLLFMLHWLLTLININFPLGLVRELIGSLLGKELTGAWCAAVQELAMTEQLN